MEKLDSQWKEVIGQDLAQLNDLMRKSNILAVGISKPEGEEAASH